MSGQFPGKSFQADPTHLVSRDSRLGLATAANVKNVSAHFLAALIDSPHQIYHIGALAFAPKSSARAQHVRYDGMEPKGGHQTGVIDGPDHGRFPVDGTI